ncbi:MAG: hypothetical protein GEU83_12310 [Pseudonocardiaceae bacterium]|nr:hypothetical protein [Pseudonocardiaceae bacterium]
MIDPEVFDRPAMCDALASRDIGRVYALLVDAGVTQREIAFTTGQSQSEVHEILHGRPVKHYDVLERIATGLGVDRGAMGLAYADDQPPATPHEEVDDDMRRRSFLAAAALAVTGRPVLGELLALPAPDEIPLPSRLGTADVTAMEALTSQLRSLARQHGGQADAASTVAHRSTRLLGAPATDPVKRSLGSALAELHTEAGWCCFDSGLHDRAGHHFRQAIDLAREAGDGYQVANTLRHAGMALADRDPNEALKLHQIGQIRLMDADSDDRTRALDAWLNAESAVAYAAMDRADDARSALARARDGWEPPDTFQRADMDYAMGAVAARLGNLDTAEQFTTVALRSYGDCRRDAAKANITHATVHVQTGDRRGLPLAKTTIDQVAELRSIRARQRLTPLAAALDSRPGSDARELAQHARQIATSRA